MNYIIMEDQAREKLNSDVNAGRGVVENTNVDTNSNSDKNTTLNQEDEKERLDERARKAGN